MEATMRIPRNHWVDFMSPANPNGLRFVEGAPEGEQSATPGERSGTQEEATKPADDGTDWKSRFEGQQQVNRDLEAKFDGLRDQIRDAFGIEGKKGSTEDLMAQMQQQMAALTKSNQVAQIAREAGITDAEDIATISEASTEEGMRRIATRIAAATEPSTPKPDRSQGGTGGDNRPDPKPGVPRLAQAFEDTFATP